jgi:hypothetical protein
MRLTVRIAALAALAVASACGPQATAPPSVPAERPPIARPEPPAAAPGPAAQPPLAASPRQGGFTLDFRPAETFRGTRIFRQANNLAYAYTTRHAAADADGAPNAYHPADRAKNCLRDAHIGLDCPRNAGFGPQPQSWWRDVLIPDPADPSRPFVQPDGPFAGFFVAMTSLRNPNGNGLDPATYVDSRKVPYIVLPTGFRNLPDVARTGDVGVATHLASGRRAAFIVADEGGGADAQLGEGSIALYAVLGFPDANPRTGAGLPRNDIQYVVFPGSRRAGAGIWPRTNDDISQQAMELVASTPGIR